MLCCSCLCSGQMQVDFAFDECVQPFSVEMQLNGCSTLAEDAVYLVPSRISQKEAQRNVNSLVALGLLPDPVYKNKAKATLDKKVVGSYYLIYARFNRIAEFAILGASRQFYLRRNASAIVMRKSIAGSDRTLEEWTRNLLRSTRIEDENEQEIIMKLFENSSGGKSQAPENVGGTDSEDDCEAPSRSLPRIVLKNMTNIPKKPGNKRAHRIKCCNST
eukprot:TRINITY_DN2550_c0_g1_i8.p2 TRINITY_DN2550_c0_g1~~TRINITY_DN2550_c0_g1_i8.p2  ORF type:complete len:218 (-),score=39.43 TRINITY_DN2550_c0_g1_i8:167-820(-)